MGIDQSMNKRKLKLNFEFKHLSLLSTVSIFFVIIFGIISRTSDGLVCSDWPTCFGTLLPPANNAALWDYLHRVATVLAVVLVAASIFWARKNKISKLVYRTHFAALFVMMLQAIIGGLYVYGESSSLQGIHLGLALTSLSLVVIGTTLVFAESNSSETIRFNWQSPFARFSIFVSGLIFLLLISGALVSGTGGTITCEGWPLCNGNLIPQNLPEAINITHRIIVGFTSIAMVVLIIMAWKTQRNEVSVLVSATAAFTLYFSQVLMGAVNAARSYPTTLIGLHSATSTAILVSMVILTVLSGISRKRISDTKLEALQFHGRRPGRLVKDFLMLTKPIVVALLLVTTFAGMVIGAKSLPPMTIIFWTLVGGFLAAGGSGAINQYIDRDDDMRMQRTSKRPIPSGRLTPGEGLAFGVAISIVSFYLMVTFVNFLAALLSLIGIIYYVVLYSLILKKTTVQNIVIGGGAGAIPPLVGWAAATGSLTFPSLLLFAVVFIWTPPHFWALAIVRKKDYARAGVPMLPVVRGEKETRWQVFIYTVELVVLTLILPIFGLGSGIYLAAAVLLGVLLLISAYKVWKVEGNKIAWKMYRYSSMYLAFLFLALTVDRLVF